MDIRNFTQFVGLLTSTGTIQSNAAFNKLATCMMVYNSLCACGGDSDQVKKNKHSECNRIYREALGAVDSIRANLFQGSSDNTLSFYMDNAFLIKTIHR
jgi:hypothetical protein